MARRLCALLLVLGLAATAAAQASSDRWSSRRPCGSSAALVRFTQAAVRVITHVSELPAWLTGQRGNGRSWGDEMKAAIEDLKLSFADAYGRAPGFVGAGE